jgi:hypothetical protein
MHVVPEQHQTGPVPGQDLRAIRTARFIARPFVRCRAGGSFYRIDNQCNFSDDVPSHAAPLCILFPNSARRQALTIASP